MKKFFKEFKTFISRGNVIDMAVGVIIASAFTAIVTAVTSKIIMPFVNWILVLITGGKGLESVYTYLKIAYVDNDEALGIDLANSIYIDWGALITAVINFFLIALILFLILKAFNAAHGGLNKVKKELPTKEERKLLKQKGVDMKNHRAVIEATKVLRDEKKQKEEAEKTANKKPTTEELLADIKNLLEKQSQK